MVSGPGVAVPLHRLSVELKTVPILTHMSICLDNWARRKGGDTEVRSVYFSSPSMNRLQCSMQSYRVWNAHVSRLVCCGRQAVLRASELRTSVSFTGQADEFSFNLITLEIEALGGPAVASLETVRPCVDRVGCRHPASRECFILPCLCRRAVRVPVSCVAMCRPPSTPTPIASPPAACATRVAASRP